MRYLTTTDPTSYMPQHPKGPIAMQQTLHQNDIHGLVQDRIGDLYTTARELREARRDECAPDTGLVTRARWSVGRRLVSIGQTVAGTHA